MAAAKTVMEPLANQPHRAAVEDGAQLDRAPEDGSPEGHLPQDRALGWLLRAVHSVRDLFIPAMNGTLATAISLARENKIPIIIFSVRKTGNFAAVLKGEGACTVVTDEKNLGEKK